MGLDKDHFAFALFYIFAAHRCKIVLQALEENNIKSCFISAHCTRELQPLDLTVNQVFKQELKACFIKWYAGVVTDQLGDGVEFENIKPDLRISVLDPLNAHWLIEAISNISSDVVVQGFVK